MRSRHDCARDSLAHPFWRISTIFLIHAPTKNQIYLSHCLWQRRSFSFSIEPTHRPRLVLQDLPSKNFTLSSPTENSKFTQRLEERMGEEEGGVVPFMFSAKWRYFIAHSSSFPTRSPCISLSYPRMKFFTIGSPASTVLVFRQCDIVKKFHAERACCTPRIDCTVLKTASLSPWRTERRKLRARNEVMSQLFPRRDSMVPRRPSAVETDFSTGGFALGKNTTRPPVPAIWNEDPKIF